MTLAALSDDEALMFMPNVQRIEAALQSYFVDDKIERFYIVYYAESLLMGDPNHLHVHLIPRFASIKTKAWDMATATKQVGFPVRYIRTEENVTELMDYLREQLCQDN
jgi:diadenosine tetraphosphate (Ap4A) HIT family hydrolase